MAILDPHHPGRASSIQRSWAFLSRHGVPLGCVAYLLLTLLLCRELWSGGTVIAGGPPDNEQKVWEIGWWAFSLTHGLNPFYTNFLTPPGHPVNLMWNNTTPLLAVLGIPATIAFGAVASFNLLIVLALWLNGAVAFLCLKPFTAKPWTAWLGGLLFGFSPYVVTELNSGRLPWLSIFLLPLIVLIVIRALTPSSRVSWRTGIGLGAIASAQFLLSEELTLTVALMALLVAATLALTHPKQIKGAVTRLVRPLAAATATGFVICCYPLFVQFYGPGHTIHGVPITASSYVSAVGGFVVPTSYQLINTGRAFSQLQSLETYGGVAATYLSLPFWCCCYFWRFAAGVTLSCALPPS